MPLIESLIQYWLDCHWTVALAMSFVVSAAIFMCTSHSLSRLIDHFVERDFGQFIDDRALAPNQIKREVIYGIGACFIFGIGSLFSRELFSSIWPQSLIAVMLQVLSFVVFYETYSYFVHRLLHTRVFLSVHSVHHKSVRVTPWSAYSVHPIEAAFIGFSAPLFMLIFPLSLSMALVLHISGMMFTILIHSNFRCTVNSLALNLIFSYPEYHSKHHANGHVNFGFVNRWWDKVFATAHQSSD